MPKTCPNRERSRKHLESLDVTQRKHERDIWVQFAAAALANPNTDGYGDAADMADRLMWEYRDRWVMTPNGH